MMWASVNSLSNITAGHTLLKVPLGEVAYFEKIFMWRVNTEQLIHHKSPLLDRGLRWLQSTEVPVHKGKGTLQ